MVPLNMDDYQPPPPLVVPNREVHDKTTRNVFLFLIASYLIYGIIFITANIANDPEISRAACETALNQGRRLDGLDALTVPSGQTVFASLGQHWPVVVFSGMLGLGAVLLWLMILKKYSLQATYFSIGVCACIWITYGVTLLTLSSQAEEEDVDDRTSVNVFAVLSLVFGGLIIAFMFRGKRRIAVTANMISWSTKAVETFPKIFAYFVGIVLVVVAFFAFFATVMVAYEYSGEYVLNRDSSQCELRFPVFPAVFFPLISIWIVAFASTVRTSIIAGTTAIWYFHADNIENFGDPVRKSARWALVEAAGSNALAALVVALCELIEALARRRRRGHCLQLVAQCILSCIRELIKMFTKFAVIVVAITGESFMNAGKISYGLLSAIFVNGFITDRLARLVLGLTSFLLTYLLYVIQLTLVGVPTVYSFSALAFFFALFLLALPHLGTLEVFMQNLL